MWTSTGVCVCNLIIFLWPWRIRAPHHNPLSPGLLIFLVTFYVLRLLWFSLKGLCPSTVSFCVYTAEPNNRRSPWWKSALCLLWLVLEDHAAPEDPVAFGNNICLVSLGQVSVELQCHLTRHEGFESMSSRCAELHHSNESFQLWWKLLPQYFQKCPTFLS